MGPLKISSLKINTFGCALSLLLSLIFFSLSAQAKITVGSVLGASNYELPTEDTNLIIYGGMAGPACTDESTHTAVCDNCDEVTGLTACNRTRIYPSLRLQIQFQSDDTSGKAMLATSDGIKIGLDNDSTTGTKGTTITAKAKWSEICSALSDNLNSVCEGSGNGTLKLGIDADSSGVLESSEASININVVVHSPGLNGDQDTTKACGTSDNTANLGICDYVAFPGDAKVFIESPEEAQGGAPIALSALRVYLSVNDFICGPNEPHPDEIVDLPISETAEGDIQLDSNIVDRLTNGELYYFRIATVDKAMNVHSFMDDEVISQACNINYDCSTSSRDLTNLDPNCPYTARPDEVLGLLSKDFNCFIATASYGSPLDVRLDDLRAFRSNILNKFSWGKKFIHMYYKKGPYAGKWIAENPWSRPFFQVLIWPLWAFAWMSVHWSLSVALLIAFLSFAIPMAAFLSLRKQTLSSTEPSRAQEERAFE